MKRLRLGLLPRSVLALIAVGIAPLGIVPYLINLNRQAVTDQVLRTHAVAARSTAARVEAFLEGLRAPLQSLAFNPGLSANPRSPLAQELLAGLLQAQPLIAGVSVENEAGGEVVRVQNRARGPIVQAVLAAPGEQDLVPHHQGGALWLRLVVPLSERGGRLRAVAETTPLEGVLQTEELGREALLAVASVRDGVIIGSTPGVALSAFPAQLVEIAGTRRVSGASRFSGKAAEALGASAPVPGTDWFVLSRQPAQVAEEVAVEMQRRSLMAAGGVLGLVAVLSLAAYRTLVRPLRELIEAQRRIAPNVAQPARGNEIEQLRAAFGAFERQNLDRAAIREVFLGRYLVVEVLGSGGMSSVFRGWDPKLQRGVALKTVHLDPRRAHAASLGGSGTLLAEAVVVAKFSHPNIVAVYDVEEAGDALFVAMELVDGMNLQSCLARKGGLPVEQVVPLGAAVARGLAAAHTHGVVHRDVKPANVLLGREGSIKVTDFGVARHVSSDARQPGDGAAVYGTPGYIAPEALQGGGQTALGDLFALGAVLYECLAGRPAFAGGSAHAALTATTTARLEPLAREGGPTIPEELDALVMSLLEKDPAHRHPATAAAVADWLERIAAIHDWRWSWDSLSLDEASSTGPVLAPTSIG